MTAPTHLHFIVDCREVVVLEEEDKAYSATYEGIVLGAAVAIVERETRLSLHRLQELLGVSKSAMYRYRTGKPVLNQNLSKRVFRELESILSGNRVPVSNV